MERITIKAEEVRVGDRMAGVEEVAGRYRGTDGPDLRVVAVEHIPENRWEGDESLVVEVRTAPPVTIHNDTITYYSGNEVEVWR